MFPGWRYDRARGGTGTRLLGNVHPTLHCRTLPATCKPCLTSASKENRISFCRRDGRARTLTFGQSSMLSIPTNAWTATLHGENEEGGVSTTAARQPGIWMREDAAHHGNALMSAMLYVPRPGPASQSRSARPIFRTPYSRRVSSVYPARTVSPSSLTIHNNQQRAHASLRRGYLQAQHG